MADRHNIASATFSLPIRRLTLYKHGVGVVEREGLLTGEELAITLRAGEVNDALKSLLVYDRRGGQVLGMRYETPADRQARLAEAPLTLSPDHSLLDLLRALRGQRVRLELGNSDQAKEIAGRLLGVDLPLREAPPAARTAISVLDEVVISVFDDATGAVTFVPLDWVRRVALLDERGAEDLRYVLDASRGDEAQRAITLRLTPGEHDLTVSYLVPSPSWRVSYRLVAASTPDAGGVANQPHDSDQPRDGELALEGWGLFDNALHEDLEEVDVTLVAGQPISFVYDLAASRVPDRPVVEDAARVAAAPVEFEAALAEAPVSFAAPAPMALRSAAIPGAAAFARSARAKLPSVEELAGQEVAASGSDLGELFEYHVTAPVTVRRGASAMAPILRARLPYRRELLFNERKLPHHPVTALRFENRAGAVLERGPVTVYQDGAYRGEAMVPFSKEGDEVYLAYAVELGIRVTTETARSGETAGIGIADALLYLKHMIVQRVTYRLANTLPSERVVTVEHPITPGFDLTAPPQPEARTAELYRWSVACAPRGVTLFTVEERRVTWQSSRLIDYSYAALQEYLNDRWLDAETLARVAPIVQARGTIERDEREVAALHGEREELYKRQEQLRQNLAALGNAGDEGQLRARAVAQLRAGEDRLEAIASDITARQESNQQRRQWIDAALATLRAGEVPGNEDSSGGADA